MNIARFLIASRQKVNLVDLEHEFVAIAELLNLAALAHRLDLIRRFLEFGSDFLNGVEHLGHGKNLRSESLTLAD